MEFVQNFENLINAHWTAEESTSTLGEHHCYAWGFDREEVFMIAARVWSWVKPFCKSPCSRDLLYFKTDKSGVPPQSIEPLPEPTRPWLVLVDVHPENGLCLHIHSHHRAQLAFSRRAAELCGGALEQDDDGHTIRCQNEPMLVSFAREIAYMPEVANKE